MANRCAKVSVARDICSYSFGDSCSEAFKKSGECLDSTLLVKVQRSKDLIRLIKDAFPYVGVTAALQWVKER
ncbi:Uncharacterized protein HZ326_16682 [Fusarium oxysporum f. sp. albedinis]|nr:Uncharacterized protein HZ326_16682 [Fusarium oxysporum f. sp. albedinis]